MQMSFKDGVVASLKRQGSIMVCGLCWFFGAVVAGFTFEAVRTLYQFIVK